MPKKNIKKTAKKNTNKSFAQQFAELEKIVDSFEDGELDIDESLKQFEKGLQLAEELKLTLGTVENKIESLKSKYQVDAD